jgi:hypothetical protein
VKMRLMVAAAAILALTAGIAGKDASAGGKVLQLGCPKADASRAYAQWGDYRYYKSFDNGGFENGTAGWRLSGGAQVVAGNEPFGVAGSGGYSLELPSGASATTSPACVRLLESWARFMVLETGASSGSLKVELDYRGLLGRWQTIRLGSISGSGEWQPSPAYPFVLENLLGSLLSLNVTTTEVKLRFTASGGGARFRLDAVMVDPWAENW